MDGIIKTMIKTILDWTIKKTELKEILHTEGALLNIFWYAQDVKNRPDIVIHCLLYRMHGNIYLILNVVSIIFEPANQHKHQTQFLLISIIKQ
jgi:hypothetical protein